MNNPFPDFEARQWIYITGPFASGDVLSNVIAAFAAAHQLWRDGFFPYMPHLQHLYHLVSPRRDEEWLRIYIAPQAKIIGVLRIPGRSLSADREEAFAVSNGIPIFDTVAEIKLALNPLRPGIF